MLNKLFLLEGWRRYLIACLLGVVAAVGYPPFGFIIAPLIAFPLWLSWLENIQNESYKKHFALAWFFGLGYFTLGLYWITFSLGVDLSLFWWLIPFALFGIPSALGVYLGLMVLILKWLNIKGMGRCFAFAFLWTVTEFAWSNGPLALPWNPMGLIWADYFPLIQSVSLIGIDGLTILTALFISFPTLYINRTLKLGDKVFTIAIAVLLIFGAAFGAMRQGSTPLMDRENIPTIRIVQPHFPQIFGWDSNLVRAEFFRGIELSMQKAEKRPDIIIWPESSLPIMLDENMAARQRIAEILKPGAYFISGTSRRTYGPADQHMYWNSLIVMNNQAEVINTYDKHHLVPFGEYVPFRWLIPSAITKVTAGEIDFSVGQGMETIEINPYPAFSPLICFEAIFSNEVIARDQLRPLWLLNISNDAWFGNSSGPYQHLQLARMRAIEEGVPLVRATNNGVSIVFDAFGREIKRLGLNEVGVLDFELPPALSNPTFFSKYGTLVYLVLLSALFGMALIFRKCK